MGIKGGEVTGDRSREMIFFRIWLRREEEIELMIAVFMRSRIVV